MSVSLATLEKGEHKPYETQTLRVKIISVGHTAKYTDGQSKEKKIINFSVADNSGAMMASLNDETKFNVISEGQSVMIRNFILRPGKIALHAQSRILKTASVTTKDEFEQRARLLVNPPSPSKSIKDILNSPKKSLVTVKGLVSKVSKHFPRQIYASNF